MFSLRTSFVLLAALLTITGAAPTLENPLNDLAARQVCYDSSSSVAFLRAYNVKQTDHYYTTSVSAMDKAVSKDGYKSQGDAGHVFTSEVVNTSPLYQLYTAKTTDNFYTTSEEQAEKVVSNGGGWKRQGIAAYVYEDQICGSIPLYQVYNPKITDHFYTTDETERNHAIDDDGYVDQGIACYVLPDDD
ncbi:uncharacterized protein LAESUDRAFT_814511 [Laetiporus sulphureus 93-53]|uniref:DUF5648 domain-containing protein n=1 Tax=Laetiporus sulphureus 93-53 TaxID=1314785 RepID=A0A165CX75_9APHY|nr:uncharacterized protein LAESUDRAFT_814511 [Laetiporus sulphureus 93-53]KZT03641.1 hypothetical protein LAESUDRAFT_814511 [Laetiporus sulphureus 93-53]